MVILRNGCLPAIKSPPPLNHKLADGLDESTANTDTLTTAVRRHLGNARGHMLLQQNLGVM
jgi:hypothetical protein